MANTNTSGRDNQLDPKLPNPNPNPRPESEPKTEEEDPNESYIVHRTNVINTETGLPEVKEHRVKLAEWPTYEKKHNL